MTPGKDQNHKEAQKVRRLAAALSCLLLSASFDAHAQERPPLSEAEKRALLDEAKGFYENIMAQLRPVLFNDLVGYERAIYRSIDFGVERKDREINAYASWSGEQRVIRMTVGMGRVLEMNSDALTLGEARGEPQFIVRYLRFVAGEEERNWKRESHGEPIRVIPDAFAFAGMSDQERDRFVDKPKNKTLQKNMFLNSFAFVLAHEVAHHVLHHQDKPRLEVPKSVQRERESAADAWAIDRMVRKGVPPTAGVIPLLLDLFNERHPAALQSQYSHPADLIRLQKMARAMKNSLEALRPNIEAQGLKFSEVQANVERMLSEIESEVSAVPGQ